MSKTINLNSLKTGDILLFKTGDQLNVPYNFVKTVYGSTMQNFLINNLHNDYIHAEIYYGDLYGLGATQSGSRFGKYSLELLSNLTIMRLKDKEIDEEKMRESINKFHNLEYDFDSLIRNSISEILNIVKLEKVLENLYEIETPNQLICSELVQRVYSEYGEPLFEREDWVSPQDLFENPKLEIIYTV